MFPFCCSVCTKGNVFSVEMLLFVFCFCFYFVQSRKIDVIRSSGDEGNHGEMTKRLVTPVSFNDRKKKYTGYMQVVVNYIQCYLL